MLNNHTVYTAYDYKKILLALLLSTSFAEKSIWDYSGYINYTYLESFSNGRLINIPYRMASVKIENRENNIYLNTNIVVEYHHRDDSYFLSSSNPQDFIIDLRELFLTYNKSNYELRLGKQIYSWGCVDENSPLDIVSGLDYYYLFFGGTEKKLASLSIALDYYIKNIKMQLVFSPLHSTNRIPLGNDDFPIKLPVYPNPKSIYPLFDKPYEIGLQSTLSTDFGDISISYFSAYDRIFNLSGVNVYGRGADISFPFVDIVYGYRKTNVFGIGGVFLNDFFTLRYDVGYFKTRDQNSSIERTSTFNPSYYDSLHFSYPLKEKSSYLQATLQIDTDLPFGINFSAQYFSHDTLDYSSGSLPVDQEINIPNLTIDPEDLTPSSFFNPGFGVPIAILTNKAIFFTLTKNTIQNQFDIQLTSMLDIAKHHKIEGIAGSLFELKLTYALKQNIQLVSAITEINGNKNHPDGLNYQFNSMENFSHLRFELKYYF